LDKRLLVLNEAKGRLGSLTVRLAGSLELARGRFRFKSGRELHYLPKLEVQLRVPRTACAKLLASITRAHRAASRWFRVAGLLRG